MADPAAKGGLIVSVHVPKTGGNTFAAALEKRYGKRLAYYYGADDPRTHPLARREVGGFDAQMFRDLQNEGVAVLHTHARTEALLNAYPEPERFWIWLREPISRTVSHYGHFRRADGSASRNAMLTAVQRDGITLAEFSALPRISRFQRRYVEPIGVDGFGFLGVTELMPQMLPLIGLRDVGTERNVNQGPKSVDLETRKSLAEALTEEVALYSAALQHASSRLRTPAKEGRGPKGISSNWRAMATRATRKNFTP
ncbi:MAG: hypothetical protein AAGB11_15160 [Pseudomonadota bacterium]